MKEGTRVRVKTWTEMETEFGIQPTGSIHTEDGVFLKEMRIHCGRTAVIESMSKGRIKLRVQGIPCVWDFSENMLCKL